MLALDRERWADAIPVLQLHGERAPLPNTEWIGALALAGDDAGVTRARQIACGVDQLSSAGPVP